MQSDGSTLPESVAEELVRAGFANDEASSALVHASLGAANPRHRVLALRAGVRRSELTADEWRSALHDESSEVRREVVALVGYHELPDERLCDDIVAALDDVDPLVVDAAAFALGERLYEPAVETLCDVALHHDDARCREAAVAALGALGDERGRAVVIGALDDKAPIRRRAIVALANFEGPDVDAALERARDDRDWQVRAAVTQLGRDDED